MFLGAMIAGPLTALILKWVEKPWQGRIKPGFEMLVDNFSAGFVAFFAFCFALAVGAMWEVFEFAMDELAGTNIQTPFLGDASGLTDTMWDLIVDALGALTIALAGYVYMKRGMTSFIERWIQRFVAGNPRLFRRA